MSTLRNVFDSDDNPKDESDDESYNDFEDKSKDNRKDEWYNDLESDDDCEAESNDNRLINEDPFHRHQRVPS